MIVQQQSAVRKSDDQSRRHVRAQPGGSAAVVVLIAILTLSVTAMLIARVHAQRIKQLRMAELNAQAAWMCDAALKFVQESAATATLEAIQEWNFTPDGKANEAWSVRSEKVDEKRIRITSTIIRNHQPRVTIMRTIILPPRPSEADPK